MTSTLPAQRILLVKTSSLGDVLHNLPVVSDIVQHFPEARIDWIVEENFASLPRLHPSVRHVIPVAVRRWRKSIMSASTWNEITAFRQKLSSQQYDLAIDTQGLFKSALIMRGASGQRCGFDRQSAREPLASFLYQHTFKVATGQHAVERNRQLVAQVMEYSLDGSAVFGILPPDINRPGWLPEQSYVVMLHATSRDDKLWDEASWITLGHYLHERNIRSILPWGSTAEHERSNRLAEKIPDAITPPRMDLDVAAYLLGSAHATIGVDTGLTHLSAALNKPTIGLYTSTDPALTGLYPGKNAINLGSIGDAPSTAAVLDALQKVSPC